MIYEVAVLPVYKGQDKEFRRAFDNVLPLLMRAQGYRGHVLAQGIETPEVFNLIVQWRSLEDHAPGFEASEDHEQFMSGIEEYFAGDPTVYHLAGSTFAAIQHEDGDGAT